MEKFWAMLELESCDLSTLKDFETGRNRYDIVFLAGFFGDATGCDAEEADADGCSGDPNDGGSPGDVLRRPG